MYPIHKYIYIYIIYIYLYIYVCMYVYIYCHSLLVCTAWSWNRCPWVQLGFLLCAGDRDDGSRGTPSGTCGIQELGCWDQVCVTRPVLFPVFYLPHVGVGCSPSVYRAQHARGCWAALRHAFLLPKGRAAILDPNWTCRASWQNVLRFSNTPPTPLPLTLRLGCARGAQLAQHVDPTLGCSDKETKPLWPHRTLEELGAVQLLDGPRASALED